MSSSPASMMAWHSASNRRTFSVMLSSTRKIARAADVGQDPVEGEGVEVAPAHLDDRAEAAIERAAARGFHHVDLAPQELVALQNARIALRRPDLAVDETVDRTVRIVVEGAV